MLYTPLCRLYTEITVPVWVVNTSFGLLQENQSSTPQPVEVCVRCLRATRDKVPKGLYSVRVGLHSRLGGSVLACLGSEGPQQGYVSTEPFKHRGQYYDIDLHINQSLTMVRLRSECAKMINVQQTSHLVTIFGV